MTESLAWEKWSSFSHNRYVEEAERFSKPGSVAQKKAFFEAHYKKLAAQKAAAAALLEQQNNAAAQNNVIDNNENNDSQKSSKYEVVVKEKQVDAKVLRHDLDSNVETCIASESESNKLEECEEQMEQDVVLRNSMMVELEKRLENVDTLQEQSEKLNATTPPTPTMTPIMKVTMLFYFYEFFFLNAVLVPYFVLFSILALHFQIHELVLVIEMSYILSVYAFGVDFL
jgi:small-conductance mechanosensitive channel